MVPVYFAQNLQGQAVQLRVGEELEAVVVGGRSYECLAIEVAEFGQRDYVTREGLLVRMTVPGQAVVIDLVSG